MTRTGRITSVRKEAEARNSDQENGGAEDKEMRTDPQRGGSARRLPIVAVTNHLPRQRTFSRRLAGGVLVTARVGKQDFADRGAGAIFAARRFLAGLGRILDRHAARHACGRHTAFRWPAPFAMADHDDGSQNLNQGDDRQRRSGELARPGYRAGRQGNGLGTLVDHVTSGHPGQKA